MVLYLNFFTKTKKTLFQSEVFDEIDISNACTAECSIKNVNHSFQVNKLN